MLVLPSYSWLVTHLQSGKEYYNSFLVMVLKNYCS